MTIGHSAGWDAVADRFVAIRSGIGTVLVRSWARKNQPSSAAILDIECGSGVPIARALMHDGVRLWGIDASPSLIAACRRNLPGMPVRCEQAQHSAFFERTFAGAVSIGLVFLLDAPGQSALIDRIADALRPGARLPFSAPREACEWRDTLTGRRSISLGADAYADHLDRAGLASVGCHFDGGGNNYYDIIKPVH